MRAKEIPSEIIPDIRNYYKKTGCQSPELASRFNITPGQANKQITFAIAELRCERKMEMIMQSGEEMEREYSIY